MNNKEITIKFIWHIVKTRRNIFLTLIVSIVCFFVGVGLVAIFDNIYWMLIILFLNIGMWIIALLVNYRQSLSIGYRIPEEIGPFYIIFKKEMKSIPWPRKITTNKLVNSLKEWK